MPFHHTFRTIKCNTRNRLFSIKYLFFSISFFLTFSFYVCAQQPVYFNYTVKDGLPGNTVYTCFQDSKGYMWFGTDKGVARYDGYKFTTFTTVDGLADNVVFDFFEDSRQRIWLASYNGNPCYYLDGNFYSKSNNPVLAKIDASGPGLKTTEDKNGNIFLLTHFRIYKITAQNEIVLIDRRINELYSSISLNSKGEAIALSSMRIINLNSGEFVEFKTKSLSKPLLNSKSIVYKDKIYFTQKTDVMCNSITGKPYYEKQFNINTGTEQTQAIYKDYDNSFLIGTKNGMIAWNPETNTINYRAFENTSVSSFFRDRENNLWITSLNNGIYLSINTKIKLLNSKSGLDFNNCNFIGLLSDGTIGLGSGDFRAAFIKDNKINNIKLPSQFGEGIVETIRIGNNKDYYLSVGSALIRVNKQFQTADVLDVAARDVLFETYNKILIAAGNSLIEINKGKIAEVYQSIKTKPFVREYGNRISNIKANGIHKGSYSGNVYVYGLFGAKIYADDTLQNILNNHEFVSKNIGRIQETSEGITWMASKVYGVVALYKNKIMNIGISNGMPSNFVNSIFADAYNNIWAASTNGLSKINYTLVNGEIKFKVTNYNQVDGLISKNINDVAVDGRIIYAATEEGVCVFTESDIANASVVPVFNLESVSFNNRIQAGNNEYKSDYKSNSLHVKFVGLSFNSLGKIMYKYIMHGLEEQWNQTYNTAIDYASVPPGKYILEIVAINSKGKASKPYRINITITPPFWSTWWFILLMGLMVTYAFFIVISKRLKVIKSRHKMKEHLLNLENEKLETQHKQAIYEKELIELEHQALRLHMNPHFIFNAINSIQGFYASGETNKAKLYISKFSGLLRMILDHSKKEFIDISDELKIINYYLELNELRFEDKFIYEIEVDRKLIDEHCSIPPMLIQPFIENAIIHGIAPLKTKGKINVSIKEEGDYIKCEISDNGVGRNHSYELNKDRIHNSTGIKVTMERIKMINGELNKKNSFEIVDMEDEQGKPTGTLVRFYVLKND